MTRKRALIIAPHGSYRTTAFLAAADRLGIDIMFASEGKHSVVSAYASGLHIDLSDAERSLQIILEEDRQNPFAGVVGTDDATTELAAMAAQQLGLPHNPPQAVRIAHRKDMARDTLLRNGALVPRHRRIDLRLPLLPQADNLHYPCVLKPLSLSASRGVIRARDNIEQFVQACGRISRLLDGEETRERHHILVEDFIPGVEVAVEGMLVGGKLSILTVFDKPDPLDGPFFEETYYTTPSRLETPTLAAIARCISDGCAAYGLCEGPIHAECRINDEGVWILEVAARTIGGLCARLLTFGTGHTLEELVLAHATRRALDCARREIGGLGVLMIPVPAAGVLRRVEGIMAAERVPFVEEITILARQGYQLVPWPEGSAYLGFMFARAPTPAQAEAALRRAHACLHFVVAPTWPLKHAGDAPASQVAPC